MQPVLNAYNPSLTADEVRSLMTAADPTIKAGMELLRNDLTVVEDASNFIVGGTISRGNLDTIHGKMDLVLEKELDWGTALIRPYVVLSAFQSSGIPGQDSFLQGRWNLGAYRPTTPDYVAARSPRQFSVQGYDQLHDLISPVGDSVEFEAQTSYIGAVEYILDLNGHPNYIIDHALWDIGMAAPRVWPIDENTSWLSIINDLLGAVGYRGLWCDWDGYFRSEPYDSPAYRPSEWLYGTETATTILIDRARKIDYFEAPNRWVAVKSNVEDGQIPVEGNGIYTYINQADGLTSVNARGRTITKMLSIEAATQAALVKTAQVTIDADMRIDQVYEVTTGPNPLHWHFDRLTLNDAEFGAPVEVQSRSWSFPLDGSPMSHTWVGV